MIETNAKEVRTETSLSRKKGAKMETQDVEQSSSRSVALVRKDGRLPSTIDKLVPFCFVAEAALKAVNAKIAAMKKIEMVNAQLDATYNDAIEVARLLFHAYERLGQLVEDKTANPIDSGRAGGKAVRMDDSLSSVSKMARELGVKRTRLEDAKSIARNPAFIETVIKEAKDRGNHTLPSKAKLLKLIRAVPSARRKAIRTKQTESKHAKTKKSIKRLASGTMAQKCTDAIVEANSYMKTIMNFGKRSPMK